MEAKKAKNVKLGKIDSSVLAIFGKTVGYKHTYPWGCGLGGGSQYIRVSKSSYVTK